MTGMDIERDRRERALVATLYLLGERGDALTAPALGAQASAFARTLADPDRQTRAVALARELARIALALDQGAIL